MCIFDSEDDSDFIGELYHDFGRTLATEDIIWEDSSQRACDRRCLAIERNTRSLKRLGWRTDAKQIKYADGI